MCIRDRLIGALAAVRSLGAARGPLTQQLVLRVTRMGEAFRQIVAAQFWIASFNTLLTAAFLILRTSPRGQQAWVAVTNAPRGFAARLKEGTGADKEASGATRVAGTANFKPAYAPNFPRILIDAAQPGLRVTTQTLDAMGVVAPARPVPMASSSAVASSGGLRTVSYTHLDVYKRQVIQVYA